LKGNYYFEGYWQSHKYYLNIRSEIIKAFEFPNLNEYNEHLASEISSSNSVGIHVRRGDYLNHKDFKGICDLVYYQSAINDLMSKSEKYRFYIFSNDIQWCIENLQPFLNGNPVVYVTENRGSDSYWDMYLMSKCHNLIIANSSFSWWGAFLNEKAKCIYAPQKWNNNYNINEICCPDWIKV